MVYVLLIEVVVLIGLVGCYCALFLFVSCGFGVLLRRCRLVWFGLLFGVWF